MKSTDPNHQHRREALMLPAPSTSAITWERWAGYPSVTLCPPSLICRPWLNRASGVLGLQCRLWRYLILAGRGSSADFRLANPTGLSW
jgi:hypothetical protein